MKSVKANSFGGASARNWLVVLVLAACVAGICGCALHKPPPHDKVVDQAVPNATIPPAWTAASGAGDVTGDWLKSFHDAGLEAVVTEAIANNLDLRQSAAQVEAARQNVIVVGAQLKPQVGATFNGSTLVSTNSLNQSTQQFSSHTEYAAVSWELDVWGRVRAQRSAAQAGYEATALDYAFARQSLAATTAKAWYLAIETRQLLALAESDVKIYQNLFELVKMRRAAGKVADLDVAEIGADLNAAQNQLVVVQGQYSEVRRTLEVLLGRYPAAELAVADAFAPLPPPVESGLPSALLERRPDILAAEHLVLAAFRNQEAAKLALLPSFSLSAEGGHLSDKLLSLVHLNPWLFQTAIGMFVPIYQGGALRAEIKIATAQQEQAIAALGGVALRAFEEVEVALTNERLLAEQLPYTQNALADRVETVRVAELKYKAGSIDLLPVLQLQAAEIGNQADLIRLHNAQLANRINLHLALGGGFDSLPAAAIPHH
jgi:NodT family efflux transporter outer membrane factor (OMF) lipoprotein